MKASELRIGNKFYLPNGEIGTVTYHEIRLLVIAQDKPDYKPIPLTEEWLLKFGFKVEERKSYSLGYEMGYKVYRFGDLVYNSIQAKWWYIRHVLVKQPEYVHELQNLFFALTGEELTTK